MYCTVYLIIAYYIGSLPNHGYKFQFLNLAASTLGTLQDYYKTVTLQNLTFVCTSLLQTFVYGDHIERPYNSLQAVKKWSSYKPKIQRMTILHKLRGIIRALERTRLSIQRYNEQIMGILLVTKTKRHHDYTHNEHTL